MCDYLWVTDRPDIRLGEALRSRGLKAGVTCLSAYGRRSAQSLSAGRLNYKIRPKWHSLAHLIHALQWSDENSRHHKTLAEEDMLGHLTQLASACPGSNILARFFQRFGLFLAMHWERIIEAKEGIPEKG
ncbi:unnamed protein product [Effrenium voratum]|nr:unnamed protein product [Effrenium voratum]